MSQAARTKGSRVYSALVATSGAGAAVMVSYCLTVYHLRPSLQIDIAHGSSASSVCIHDVSISRSSVRLRYYMSTSVGMLMAAACRSTPLASLLLTSHWQTFVIAAALSTFALLP